MHQQLFAHKTIARPSSRIRTSTNPFEWIKLGLLMCTTVVLIMMFLFLTSTTSTAGHSLNKALKWFDRTMQLYSQTKYEIAGMGDITMQGTTMIPTNNLGYKKNIVAVGGSAQNFAINR